MSDTKAPAPIKTTLDLDLVIFDGDRDMRAAMMDDPEIAAVYREQASKTQGASARRDLLLTSMRLTPSIVPELFESVTHCIKALGIEEEVEIFCSQDPVLSAWVVPPTKGKILIGFSNVALERFDDNELKFVLGHELGHTIYNHHSLRRDMFENNSNISPLNLLRYFAWKRYAELTCDRVGLLCCGDFNVAVRTFFKLTSGLSHPRWMRNVTDAAMHYAVKEASAIEQEGTGDWYSTHPYSPMRVKALDLFARSKTYHKLLGTKGGELTEKKLESEVAAIVDMMNPPILSESLDYKDELIEFFAAFGLMIARADNDVSKSETRAIVRLMGGLKKHAAMLAKLQKLDNEALAARAKSLGVELYNRTSHMRRLKILEDVISIAQADGQVTEGELAVLTGLCEFFDVNTQFIPDVLARGNKPLD